MSARLIASLLLLIGGFARAGDNQILFSGERKLNNLVSVLLEVSSVSQSSSAFTFTRSSEGWVFIALSCEGKGVVNVALDKEQPGSSVIVQDLQKGGSRGEAMRYVAKGPHAIKVE
jgi:hypothetical protein